MPAFEHLRKDKKRLFIGVIVGLIVFVSLFALHALGLFELAELKSLDHRFNRYADPSQASQDIVAVVIDEASLEAYQEQLGRWP